MTFVVGYFSLSMTGGIVVRSAGVLADGVKSAPWSLLVHACRWSQERTVEFSCVLVGVGLYYVRYMLCFFYLCSVCCV